MDDKNQTFEGQVEEKKEQAKSFFQKYKTEITYGLILGLALKNRRLRRANIRLAAQLQERQALLDQGAKVANELTRAIENRSIFDQYFGPRG